MTMNNNFFDICEQHDYKLLEKFNEQYGWISGLTNLIRFTSNDASGFTQLGDKIVIELKDRGFNEPFPFSSVFIEPTKLEYCRKRKAEGFKTAYINFIDGKAWVCDPTASEWKSIWLWIYNKGKGKKEYVKRYMIPVERFRKYPLKISSEQLYFKG